MARCVHCKKETKKFTLIEGFGRIAVCEECMESNDIPEDAPKLREMAKDEEQE